MPYRTVIGTTDHRKHILKEETKSDRCLWCTQNLETPDHITHGCNHKLPQNKQENITHTSKSTTACTNTLEGYIPNHKYLTQTISFLRNDHAVLYWKEK